MQSTQGQNLYPDIELYRHATSVEGGIYVAGWNIAINAMESWAFDVQTQVWAKFGDCSAVTAAGKFASNGVLNAGGFLIMLGGATDDLATKMVYVPTSQGPTAQWRIASTSNMGDAHDGHRAVVFGGIMYMVGGLVKSTGTWSNAMWGLDVNGYFNAPAGTGPLAWVRMTEAGYNPFAARGAHSLEVYAGSIVLFGGLTRNPSASPPGPGASVCSVANAQCVVFNDLWSWAPGVTTGMLKSCPDAVPGTPGNCGWMALTSSTTPPPARFDHASGVYGAHLFIWGGMDATGLHLTDLWSFNFETRAWAPVVTTWTGPLSSWPPQTVPVSGFAVVGRRLYFEATGDENHNALYRYTPEWSGAVAPPAPAAATSTALTAGVAFASIFSALSCAVLFFMLWRTRAGAGASYFPSAGGGSAAVDVYASLDNLPGPA